MIKLKQLIPEIKIQNRNKPHNNEQLYDFIMRDKKDFVKELNNQLGWNILIFDNNLDYNELDNLILITTIGDRGESYVSYISINEKELLDEAGEIDTMIYKDIKIYVGK